MLSRPAFPFKLAHISLAFVGLMWVLPFLYYRHAYPITTFYQEWGAGVLGLCAMPLLLTTRYWQAPEVPRIVALPIGLMLLLMIQFFIGRIGYLDHTLLMALYFLFAALLIMVGQRLRLELGLPAMGTALALVLLVGAELNALAGILQHYRWHTFLNQFVTAKTTYAVYGNTAQPNHFASYVAMGLISLGLLHVRLSMRVWLVALLAAPLLFVMVLSGSRSPWLYLLFAAGLAFLCQRRDRSLRPVLGYSLLLLLGFGLMHWVVQIPWLAGAGSITSAERLFGDNASGHIRMHLWREAALIFERFPLLGAGFGQFAFQHLQLAAELRNPLITGLYNNAHNLVMQIAAEAGLAGLAVLMAALGAWFWQSIVRGAQFTVFHWWGYAVLAVLGVHSLLEYPLWYAHFIGIAAIMLGMYDITAYRLELRAVGRAAVAMVLVLGIGSLFQAYQGYQHLERAVTLQGMAARDHSLVLRARDELTAAYEYPVLRSYSELFLANMMEPGPDRLKDKLALNERALHFIPASPVAYRQSLLLAWSDRPDEARAVLERAIWAYPADFRLISNQLTALARTDPSRFSALLEFATQKYEEYRRAAVPAK